METMGGLILRDYRSEDCGALIDLFRNTVRRVNIADYTQEQVEAWAPDHIDSEAWDTSLRSRNTLVAEISGSAEIVGFADMTNDGYLDRLYVHADHQHRGIATKLCDRLENAATASTIMTHSSITARPFFERRGYAVLRSQQVTCRGIVLTNFVMAKHQGEHLNFANSATPKPSLHHFDGPIPRTRLQPADLLEWAE